MRLLMACLTLILLFQQGLLLGNSKKNDLQQQLDNLRKEEQEKETEAQAYFFGDWEKYGETIEDIQELDRKEREIETQLAPQPSIS